MLKWQSCSSPHIKHYEKIIAAEFRRSFKILLIHKMYFLSAKIYLKKVQREKKYIFILANITKEIIMAIIRYKFGGVSQDGGGIG